MSSTRKIEGRATSLMGSYEFIEGPEVPPQGNPWKPATLIIGKAYTQEEHEAEFQRRAKAMVMEMNEEMQMIHEYDGVSGYVLFERKLKAIATKHGIQLP